MSLYVTLACVVILSCFPYTHGRGEAPKHYVMKGETTEVHLVAEKIASGPELDFPGRPWLKDRSSFTASSYSNNKGTLKIKDVNIRDSGLIIYGTGQASAEIELVVFEAGKVQDVQIKVLAPEKISVSWKAPLQYPELVVGYTVGVFLKPTMTRVAWITREDKEEDENGQETALVADIGPADYVVKVTARYVHGQKRQRESTLGPCKCTDIFAELWEGPELSIHAVALTSHTALVSYKVIDSEEVSGLEVSYSGDQGESWTDIKIDSPEKYTLVSDLQPQKTYLFKVKAVLRLGPRHAVVHLDTRPGPADSPPTDVEVTPDAMGNIAVSWQHEISDGVLGYTVTFEEQLGGSQSYRIATEVMTKEKQTVIYGLPDGPQYRVKVRPYDLSGLGTPSEGVMYPEVEDDATETYALDVLAAKESSNRLRVLWFIARGDPNKVGSYQVTLVKNGRKIFKRNLRKHHRAALLLASLNSPCVVIVRALNTAKKVLAEKSFEFIPQPPGDAELLVEANEIQDGQLRVGWILKNFDTIKLRKIRMSIYRNDPSGERLTTRTISPNKPTIKVSRVPPNRTFFILIEALGQDGPPFLRSALTLKTPPSGQVGQRVVGGPYNP